MTNTLTTPLPTEPEAIADTTEVAEILAEFVQYTPVGLVIKGELPFEKWEKGVSFHMALRTRTQWMIGDYIRYGEKYGEKYAQAVDFGKSDSRLQTYVSVCSRFPIERRREALSFDHHAECAYIDPREADAVLVRAQREGWSKQDVRDEVAKINERNGVSKPKRKSKTAAQIAASGKSPTEIQPSLPGKTTEATTPAPEAPQKPPVPQEDAVPPLGAPNPGTPVQTPPAAQIEPDQNVALERAEVALNRLEESAAAVDWDSMKPLARKKWLQRLVFLDNLIDRLQQGL